MTRVLVVDDSATARRLLVHILSEEGGFHVVGEASDGAQAVRMVEELRPDVVTMDIRMPVMDGYAATEAIMGRVPTPIVMVSAHEPDDVDMSFRALEAGAVTVLAKPLGPGDPNHGAIARELVATVRTMAGLKLVTRRSRGSQASAPDDPVAVTASRRSHQTIGIVAICASTGGPMAMATILRALSGPLPVPVVVVQHIADGFDAGLASWLDSLTPLPVRLGRDGDHLVSGEVVLAPNGAHLGVSPSGRLVMSDDPPLSGHRPSATHLFRSLASGFADRALGVILTGIGSDGRDGLEELRASGGRIIAQDEETSVVWGMPGVVARAGLADEVLPIDAIGDAIWRACAARQGSP